MKRISVDQNFNKYKFSKFVDVFPTTMSTNQESV